MRKIKAKTFEFARRHYTSPKCIQLLLGGLFLAYITINTHYNIKKNASVPVPAFDANAKCFGGGWFKAVPMT